MDPRIKKELFSLKGVLERGNWMDSTWVHALRILKEEGSTIFDGYISFLILNDWKEEDIEIKESPTNNTLTITLII